MLNVHLYKASFSTLYARGLTELENQKIIKLNVLSSQVVYDLLVYLNNKSSLFRKLRKRFTNRSEIFQYNPSIKGIIKSFFAPLTLLFTRRPIILGFSPYSSMIYYMWLLKLLHKKIIYFNSWPYWEGDYYVIKPKLFEKRLWQSFLKNIEAVCVSKKGASAFKKFGSKSHWIPHPVDTTIFSPKAKPASKKTKVLFVGRLVEEKGLLSIAKVSKEIKNIEVRFAGEGKLFKQLKTLEKTHPIKVIGYIQHDDLPKFFNSSNIFVLNSYKTKHWEELFGIVLVEAMACGLPIITSDCVGPKEIIKNTKAGILIPQKDDKALKKALSKLASNKKLRESMGKEGRRLALEYYDISKVADKWLRILKN